MRNPKTSMRMWNQKWFVLLLTAVLILTVCFAITLAAQENDAVAVQSTTISGKQTITKASEFPLVLQDGADVTLQGPLDIDYRTNYGQSPITIAEGASVTITISGKVTLRGANARLETAARAAINVPESASLVIRGAHDNRKDDSGNALSAPIDSLTVYGGNAANGRDGTDAGYSLTNPSSDSFTWFGGGAAAAIGGNGGAGGTGGVNKVSKNTYWSDDPIVLQKQSDGTWYIDHTFSINDSGSYYSVYSKAATSGAVGQSAGKISVVGYLTLNGQGGAPAKGGIGGCGEQSRFISNVTIKNVKYTSDGSLVPLDLYIAGDGGGGGGLAAPFIGSGGAGGAGGGAGGVGGGGYTIFTYAGRLDPYMSGTNLAGGAGGGGGWPNGGGGAGGTGCGVDASTSKSSYGFGSSDNYASIVVALKKAGKDIQLSDITDPIRGGDGGAVGASGANGQNGYPMRYESEGLTHYNDAITTQVGGGGIGAGGRYATDGGSTGTVGSGGQAGAGKTDPSPWNKDFIISTSVKMPLTGVSSTGSYTDPFIHESYKNSDATDRWSSGHTTCFGDGDGYYAKSSSLKGKLPNVIYDLRDCYVRYASSPTYTCEGGTCGTAHTYNGGKHTPTLYGTNGLVSSLGYYESNDEGNYLVHNFWFVMSAGGTDATEWKNSVQISDRSDLVNCPGKVVIAGVYADYEDMTAHYSEILDALLNSGNTHRSSNDKGNQTAKWMIVGSLEKELDIQKATIDYFVIGAKGTLNAKNSYTDILREDDAYSKYAMVSDLLDLKAGSAFTSSDMDTTMWYQSHQYSVELAELAAKATIKWTVVSPDGNADSSALTGSGVTAKTFQTAAPGMYTVTLDLSDMTNFTDMRATVYLFIRQQLTVTITGTLHPGCVLTAELGNLPEDVLQKITYVWAHNGTAFTASEGTFNGGTFLPSYSHFGEPVTVTVTYDASITDQQKSPYIAATSGGVTLSHDFGTDATHNGFCHIKLANGSFCGEYQQPDMEDCYDENDNWYPLCHIKNAGQLFYFAALVNGDSTHVHTNTGTLSAMPNAAGVLEANIDLLANNPNAVNGAAEWTPIGNTATLNGDNLLTAGGFTGEFNGNGKTISNLSITIPKSCMGLFAYISTGANIHDFTVTGKIAPTGKNNLGGDTGIGGVVGHASGGKVSGVVSDVTITGNQLYHVGGIIGTSRSGDFVLEKSINRGDITLTNSGDSIGGLAGYFSGKMTYCANVGNVTVDWGSSNTSAFLVGGAIGQSGSATFTSCFTYGSLTGTRSGYTKTDSAKYTRAFGMFAGQAGVDTTFHSCTAQNDRVTLNGITSPDVAYTIGHKLGTNQVTNAMPSAGFASGIACYLLNGNTSGDGNVWRLNIDNGNGPEAYPHLQSTATDDIVYYRSDDTYSNDPEKISVTITWGAMEFYYTVGRWNPETHAYEGTNVGWSATAGAGDLSVQNDSNVALNVAFVFTPDTAFDPYGLTGSFRRADSTAVDAAKRIDKGTNLSVTLTLQSLYPKVLETTTGTTQLGNLTIRLTTITGGGNG